MTRQDYVAIAKLLSDHMTGMGDWDDRRELVCRFATLFADDNHNFSREKWFAACGVSDPTVGDKVNNLREQLGV